jgi:hypothetical protein
MAKKDSIRSKVKASQKQEVKYTPSFADLEYLTPGSNWTSESGVVSTVLFIANQKVPAARQDKFPISVVFSDSEGNIFSVDRDIFLAKRKFHNVAPEVELAAEDMLAMLAMDPSTRAQLMAQTDESEADDDLDETEGDMVRTAFDALTDKDHPILAASRAAIAEQPKDTHEHEEKRRSYLLSRFAVSKPDNEQTTGPAVTAQELSSSLVAYRQAPDLNNPKQLVHELTFAVKGNINADTLYHAFSPEDAEQKNRQFYSAFSMGHTSVGLQHEVDWDYLVGVFPAYYDNSEELFVDVQFVTVLEEEQQSVQTAKADVSDAAPQPAQWQSGAETVLNLATETVSEETIQQSNANPIQSPAAQAQQAQQVQQAAQESKQG